MSESMIRDISLADEGLQRISWVEKFMPALNTLREEFVKSRSSKARPSSCPSISKRRPPTLRSR